MEEVHIDDELDAMEAKARAWDMLAKSVAWGTRNEDDTQYNYDLRERMELFLKVSQEKEEVDEDE